MSYERQWVDLIYPSSKCRASILSIGLGCLRKTEVDLMHPGSKHSASILSVGLGCLFRKKNVDLMYPNSKRRNFWSLVGT